jgi:hypothetical protein
MPLDTLFVFFLSLFYLHHYLLYLNSVFHTKSENKPMLKPLTLLHITSLETDDKHQHPATSVQTTLNVTTCYNKMRYSKAGHSYRKYVQ